MIPAVTEASGPVHPDAPDHLNGLIERVTFHNEESAFAVLRQLQIVYRTL